MKVFHHVYNFWDYSGATSQAIKLSENLGLKSKDIVFVNSDSYKGRKLIETNGHNTVYNLPSSKIMKIIVLLWLFGSNRKNVIHHFHGFHLLEMLCAAIMGRNYLFKCTLLGKDDLNALLKRRFSFLIKYILERSSYINSLNFVIDEINKSEMPELNYVVIPNGVVLPTVINGSKRDKFIFAGAVVKRKRPDLAIRYYNKHLARTGIPLFIVGPNSKKDKLPEYDHTYAAECTKLAESSDGTVIFKGAVSREELLDLMKESLALIFFSEREGTPNVVLEAMSNNTPVIFDSSDRVVEHLLGNYLSSEFNDQNTINLKKLDEYILNQDFCKRSEEFSIEKTAKLTIELYQSMLVTRT